MWMWLSLILEFFQGFKFTLELSNICPKVASYGIWCVTQIAIMRIHATAGPARLVLKLSHVCKHYHINIMVFKSIHVNHNSDANSAAFQEHRILSITLFSRKHLKNREPLFRLSSFYEGVSNKFCPRVFSRYAPQVLPPGV